MNKHYHVKSSRVKTLKDLETEKARLRLEIVKQEETIRSDYRRILDSFTLRSLTSNILEDASLQSKLVVKAIKFGKSYIEKRRKRKLEKQRIQSSTP
jgi:hypothetical protein